MPHVIVEYSANLDDSLDIGALVHELHRTMVESGIAEVAAIRTRAERRDLFEVADGNPANGFVHIVVRMRVGRPEEQRRKLGEALLAAANKCLEAAYKTHPTGVTVEIHEIDHMTFRRNTIRDRASAA